MAAPAKKSGDFYVLQVDPGKKYYNIKIYISSKDYLGLSGVPITEENIGGVKAISLNNCVYGIKAGGYYYTFDIGYSMTLRPTFVALTRTFSSKI